MRLGCSLRSLLIVLVCSCLFTVTSVTALAQSAEENNLSLTAMQQQTGKSDNHSDHIAMPSNTSINPHELYQKPSKLDQQAFQATAQEAMPMTPYQINQLKKRLTATQQASSAPAGTPPEPVTSSIMIDLSPGSTPPAILLQQGFISSLVFVDAAGNKWPIEGYDIGNPNAFSIQWQKNSNVLLVQASTLFTYGNLAVKLKGLATPVMLTLIPGQKKVDYRADIHVPGQSPTAPASSGSSGLPKQADNKLLKVLNGIPPQNTTTLQVKGGSCDSGSNNCQAWYDGTHLFLRIPMNILSPGWISTMRSSDGMHAYEMEKTPSVLVSDYGKTTELKIEGF